MTHLPTPEPEEHYVWYPIERKPSKAIYDGCAMHLFIPDFGQLAGGYVPQQDEFFIHAKQYDDFDDELANDRNTVENINNNLEWEMVPAPDATHWMLIPDPGVEVDKPN